MSLGSALCTVPLTVTQGPTELLVLELLRSQVLEDVYGVIIRSFLFITGK